MVKDDSLYALISIFLLRFLFNPQKLSSIISRKTRIINNSTKKHILKNNFSINSESLEIIVIKLSNNEGIYI